MQQEDRVMKEDEDSDESDPEIMSSDQDDEESLD